MHQQLDAFGKHQLDARLQYWRFQVFLAGANLVRSTQKTLNAEANPGAQCGGWR